LRNSIELLKPGGTWRSQPPTQCRGVAILTATGAQHVYTWTEVEQLVGRFALEKRLVKPMPFYGAIFAKPAREAFR
jgi:hypothetical protein